MPQAPVALGLRAIGLGDLLTGVPALRLLRAALPGHHLVLATSPGLEPLVDLADTVDEVLAVPELAPVPWRGPVDVAVDLHGNGPASSTLLERLQPRQLLSYASGTAAWDPDEHEVHRWCRLVAQGLGVPLEVPPLALRVPDVEPAVAGAVVVHPGAASGSRRWHPGRFAAVARSLADVAPVVVTGSAAERSLALDVALTAGLGRDAAVTGTGLAELAALVASGRLVVCGDTGVAHLASAYAVPSVVLFGPTPPSRWGPPADGPHTVLWHGSGVGDPHADAIDPALAQVSVDEVVEACRVRLRSGRRAPAPAPPS